MAFWKPPKTDESSHHRASSDEIIRKLQEDYHLNYFQAKAVHEILKLLGEEEIEVSQLTLTYLENQRWFNSQHHIDYLMGFIAAKFKKSGDEIIPITVDTLIPVANTALIMLKDLTANQALGLCFGFTRDMVTAKSDIKLFIYYLTHQELLTTDKKHFQAKMAHLLWELLIEKLVFKNLAVSVSFNQLKNLSVLTNLIQHETFINACKKERAVKILEQFCDAVIESFKDGRETASTGETDESQMKLFIDIMDKVVATLSSVNGYGNVKGPR